MIRNKLKLMMIDNLSCNWTFLFWFGLFGFYFILIFQPFGKIIVLFCWCFVLCGCLCLFLFFAFCWFLFFFNLETFWFHMPNKWFIWNKAFHIGFFIKTKSSAKLFINELIITLLVFSFFYCLFDPFAKFEMLSIFRTI